MQPTYRQLETIVRILEDAYSRLDEAQNKRDVRINVDEGKHRVWDAMQLVKDLGENTNGV